jgi:hypothetical protein
MHLLGDAEIFRQAGKTISICSFPDDAALQAGMRAFHSGERPQHNLVPFSCQQIPDNQNVLRAFLCGFWLKHSGIRAIVDNFGCNRCGHSLLEQSLHPAADTDHFAGALIDFHRSAAAPSCSDSLLKATVEHVQTMNGNHEWNAQSL